MAEVTTLKDYLANDIEPRKWPAWMSTAWVPNMDAVQEGEDERTGSMGRLFRKAQQLSAPDWEGFAGRTIIISGVGFCMLLTMVMLVGFLVKPRLRPRLHNFASQVPFLEKEVEITQQRQLWCTYEPSHGSYTLSDVPVKLCNVVIYCCVDLGPRGIRYFNPNHDEGHAGVDVFHTLKERRFDVALYAFLGNGIQTTAAFVEQLSGVSMTSVIQKVKMWLKDKQLRGLVFYHQQHREAADIAYTVYYREFVLQLRMDNYFVSAVVRFTDHSPHSLLARILKGSQNPVVLRSHDTVDVSSQRTSCPIAFRSSNSRLLTFGNYVDSVQSAQDTSRLLFSLSLTWTSYRLNDSHLFQESSPGVLLSQSVPYSTMCTLVKKMGFSAFVSTNESDCVVVHKGRQWYSGFGPDTRQLFRITGGFLGAMVLNMHSDDFQGLCGESNPLLRYVHDVLGMF